MKEKLEFDFIDDLIKIADKMEDVEDKNTLLKVIIFLLTFKLHTL